MRIKQRIAQEPDASPAVGVSVRLIRKSDGATLDAQTTDANGYVFFERSGQPGEYYLRVPGAPGGDQQWSSYDAGQAGPINLADVPLALRTLGDGVIRGFDGSGISTNTSDLIPFVGNGSGNDTIFFGEGAAIVGGIPITEDLILGPQSTYTPVRPPPGVNRIDRMYVLTTTAEDATNPSFQGIEVVLGEEAYPAEIPDIPDALIATRSVMPLCLVHVHNFSPLFVQDERPFSGLSYDEADFGGLNSAATTSASGEVLVDSTYGVEMTFTLALPRAGTYDVEATLIAYQTQSAGYGEIAIAIDGSVSPYLGIGNRPGWVENVAVGTATGGGVVEIGGYGKATSGTLGLTGVILYVRAIPRRL